MLIQMKNKIFLERLNATTDHLLTAILSLLIGSFLLFVVGFSSSDALHQETHDVRHSLSFPCH